jgi:hypothetical protein
LNSLMLTVLITGMAEISELHEYLHLLNGIESSLESSLRRTCPTIQSVRIPLSSNSERFDDDIRKRLLSGKCRRNESFIRQVFDKHGVKTVQHPDGEISIRNLEFALLELGVSGDANTVFADMDVNGDGIVDFEEFRAAVGRISSVESWAKRIPWWQAVADAMPEPRVSGDDPLRMVAGLSDEQIDAVCRVVAEETAAELHRQIKHLEWSFLQMDLAEQERTTGGAGAKFQTFKANAGTIENFYAGLGGRVG